MCQNHFSFFLPSAASIGVGPSMAETCPESGPETGPEAGGPEPAPGPACSLLPECQPPGGVGDSHATREELRQRARRRGSRKVGIHALEVYTPRHACSATELEKAHGTPGKYSVGLLMREFCGPDWDEDPVSFALTAIARLMWRNGLRHADIGMIQVGTESLLDRSKSIKSNLMALFEEHGVTDIQGTDQYNACYGGTAALLNCLNWVESAAWDGRWALAVATDIADAPAQYRFMVGAACTVTARPGRAARAVNGVSSHLQL